MTTHRWLSAALGFALLGGGVAAAQVGPGTMPGTGAPASEEEEKPEGVAESAPKTPGILPTTPALPPQKGKRKKFELLELDGYFRFRGDYFKNFNLGFRDDPALGGSPFPLPIGCHAATDGSAGDISTRPCGDSVKSANMRLRLEPTINLDETIGVHTQVDVLDNVVLGSTPAGNPATLGAFGDGQDTPVAGANSLGDSIAVKRAWAEVHAPLGVLSFGRMPAHWGLGIYANGGGEDPINGGYNLDADGGDTVDRVMFGTLIPGTPFRAGVAVDWPLTRPVSSQTTAGTARAGQQAWDLDDNDDVTQYVFVLSRMDKPDDFKDTVDRGELALNYGVYFTYRTQSWDYDASTLGVGGSIDADMFVPRDAKAYIPDVWARLGWGDLLVELEAVAAIGHIAELTDQDPSLDQSVDLRQWGGVARGKYRAMENKLEFGLELGAASGDQYDSDPQGATHVSSQPTLPNASDDALTWFRFDPNYHVDLILFRELIGTVTNAVYTKPFVSYELTKAFKLKVANVTSFAMKPVATPGNGTMYGTEFDADIGYENGGFSMGLAYGLLFPLDAMDHPSDDLGQGGDGFGYDDTNVGNAGNAHTLQMRLGVQF